MNATTATTAGSATTMTAPLAPPPAGISPDAARSLLAAWEAAAATAPSTIERDAAILAAEGLTVEDLAAPGRSRSRRGGRHAMANRPARIATRSELAAETAEDQAAEARITAARHASTLNPIRGDALAGVTAQDLAAARRGGNYRRFAALSPHATQGELARLVRRGAYLPGV